MNSKNDQLVEDYDPVYLVFVSVEIFFFSILNVFSLKIHEKSEKNRKNPPKIRHMPR